MQEVKLTMSSLSLHLGRNKFHVNYLGTANYAASHSPVLFETIKPLVSKAKRSRFLGS